MVLYLTFLTQALLLGVEYMRSDLSWLVTNVHVPKVSVFKLFLKLGKGEESRFNTVSKHELCFVCLRRCHA